MGWTKRAIDDTSLHLTALLTCTEISAYTLSMSNRTPQNVLKNMQRMFQQMQENASRAAGQGAQRGGGYNGHGGGGGQGGGPMNPAVGGAGIIALAGLALGINASLFNVDGGHRAIKYSRVYGVRDMIFNEGTHLLIPWFETPIDYDVRALSLIHI